MHSIYIFILIFIVGIILFFSCYKFDVATFNSNKPGKNILIIAGTHGNEPSGTESISVFKNLLKNRKLFIKSGKLTIISNLNKCGYYTNTRFYNKIGKEYDLNRLYSTNFIVNKKVEELVKKNDIILDFHEGWGYINRDKYSIGSSITYDGINKNDIVKLIKILNEDINKEYKKFAISNRKIIRGSLREYSLKNNKSYILLETTGQNNIQHINTRINQCNIFLLYFLKKYNMI